MSVSTPRIRLLRTANTIARIIKRRKVVVPILAPIVILCRGKLSVLSVGGPGDRLVDGDADGTAERLTDGVGVTAVLALLFGSMGTRSVGIASSNLACEMEKFERS